MHSRLRFLVALLCFGLAASTVCAEPLSAAEAEPLVRVSSLPPVNGRRPPKSDPGLDPKPGPSDQVFPPHVLPSILTPSPVTGPVRIADAVLRLAIEGRLVTDLPSFGLVTSDSNEHWLEDVTLNEYGELTRTLVGSVIGGTDMMGKHRDLLCESSWLHAGGLWRVNSELTPHCDLLENQHPARGWSFLAEEWYPHSGGVDPATFRKLYLRFEDVLKGLAVYAPSWSRDAWILRASVDSDLRVKRVSIYASALLDRLTVNIEKRADCFGESVWNEISGWETGMASCRLQFYRLVRSCTSVDPRVCDSDWEVIDEPSTAGAARD